MEILEVAAPILTLGMADLRCQIGVVQHVGFGLEEVDLLESAGDLSLGIDGVLQADGMGIETRHHGSDKGQYACDTGCD